MNQEKALAILKSGRNVFLTGSAGTGKTYVLNQFVQHLKDARVKVAVTASTGIAATHIKGSTIHSWSGIGIKNEMSRRDLMGLRKIKQFKDQVTKAKVLIIDEISMLHRRQLDAVNKVVQFIRDDTAPFGGLQIVVCGDFFQLPPIGQYGERSSDKFAFMSQSWQDAQFKVCYLTEQFRQTENKLHQILSEVRQGNIGQESRKWLNEAQSTQFEKGVEPTKLYTHNEDVNKINVEHLIDLPGKLRSFKAKTTGPKNIVEALKKSVLTETNLQLKPGAKVMFVKNNTEKGYINGTLGEVLEYSSIGLPVVKTTDGQRIKVNQEEWSVEDEEGKAVATYTQIPLRLAWAITVHKSQGMTLDAAELDLTKTFERGQGYVALSRLKNIETLRLLGYNNTALMVDGLAMKADLRFQELSRMNDVEHLEDELLEEQKTFIRASGGRVLKKL